MANEYLKRTPTSTGNRKTFTISVWSKISSNSNANTVCDTYGDAANFLTVRIGNSGNQGALVYQVDASIDYSRYWNVADRDHSSWMHHLFAFNSTAVDAGDRLIYYRNGVKQTNYDDTYGTFPRDFEFKIDTTRSFDIFRNIDQSTYGKGELSDYFFVDGQALTPDVFGFYKEGKGYISAGSTQATDFRPGQWVPKTPRIIKAQIERNGGFGVNGFYLPMNDSSNFGADFHCEPNSIITLKGEDLPQPKNGAPETTDAYVSQLRTDPYAANLVLALPFVSGGLGTDGTSSGINTGFGDYSAIIRGSGSAKVSTLNGGVSIANTAAYYGSAVFFDGSDDYITTEVNSDFELGSEDFTVEAWVNYKSGTGGDTPFGLDSPTTTYAPLIGHVNLNTPVLYMSSTGSSWDIASSVGFGATVATGQWTHLAVSREGTNIRLFRDGVGVGIITDVGSKSVYQGANQISFARIQNTTYYDGHIQDFRLYKGVAKYKGGFDVPKPYTPVGIATWRAVPDCTANNFATWNNVDRVSSGGLTLSDGNLSITNGASYRAIRATVGIPTTGKWYYEHRESTARLSSVIGSVGIATNGHAWDLNSYYDSFSGFYWGSSGLQLVINGTNSGSGWISSPGIGGGDILNIAYDADSRNLWLGINGTYYTVSGVTLNGNGNPSSGTNPTGTVSTTYSNLGLFPLNNAYSTTSQTNFGQNPTFSGNTTAGTFTDSNGKGLFKYQPPSGFLALCEDNLPTPAISDPGKYFKTVLYTGDGAGGRSITGIGFTPDLVWIKGRTNATYDQKLWDSVRGPLMQLEPSSTSVEASVSNSVLSFDSDGFSVGSYGAVNLNASSQVAWCWRAGAGTTSTNTDGSIQSVVSVNQTAGFSIVSYTGNNANATVGHGLGKTPSMIIVKQRNSAQQWYVKHKSLTSGLNVRLNDTSAEFGVGTAGNIANLTSSTTFSFNIGSSDYSGPNANGGTYIAYCWAEIEGFSKFGSYVGNGNADGPFVYCGFKPAFVLVKNASGIVSWTIVDNARDSVNTSYNSILFPDTADIENAGANKYYDFVSNGFKVRGASSAINANGNTMIFAAFAESPFSYSNSK